MTATAIHILLLWIAVFVGLDVAFGEGVLTTGIEDALVRAIRHLRKLFGLG
jgi:hypothetical protein